MGRCHGEKTQGTPTMTYFDRPGYAYCENDELYMREIRLIDLDNNPDCIRDFDKPGYWVKMNSPMMAKLLDARCNMLTTHLQARRRYDQGLQATPDIVAEPPTSPQPHSRITRTRRR